MTQSLCHLLLYVNHDPVANFSHNKHVFLFPHNKPSQKFLNVHYSFLLQARQIGVFSCGPPPMTLNVDRACTAMNKYEDFPAYLHHFENF